MGECMSTMHDETDKDVQNEIDRDKLLERSVYKLLLLGAGGSGKSTFFKQLKTIHGDGHSQREKESFKKQIYDQVVEGMQSLVRHCNVLVEGTLDDIDDDERLEKLQKLIDNDDISDYKISDEFTESCKYLMSLSSSPRTLDDELTKHITKLWTECKPIHKMFEHRNKICVPDSTSYFLDAMDRISHNSYVPDAKDIMLVRNRTTGMQEREFRLHEATFKILDVGGQRNERKKWMNFFDGVTAVLFVISLTCYDEIPFEDVTDLEADISTSNNMLESIKVFKETLAVQYFANTTFILFFNKADLMQEKIKHVPITCAFPDYKGPQEFGPSVSYIRDYFLAFNHNENREIFLHTTTATDRGNVQKVFDDVQQCIVNWSIKNAGLA